jgi:predicted amidophosphoribosyltransferase
MEGDLVKLCPRCGSEYQMRVERCLDCGATLVVAREGQGAIVPEPMKTEETPAIPPGAVHLRTAAVAWIGRLSEDLDEAGIRHWVTPPVWRRDPSLYVSPDDLEAASQVDHQRYALEVPEVAAGDAQPRRAARPARREPSADDLGIKVCPSCGGEFQLWAEKCADCGVPLVRPWDVDSAPRSEPQVLAPVPVQSDDPGLCPACGERIAEGAPECPGCGLMMAQPDACPNCGVELEPHVASCRRCGFEFFGMPEG